MTDIFYKKKCYNKYYYANKEKILQQEQLYYQMNRLEIREKQRIYFRKYYLLNKDKIIENCQRRYYGSKYSIHAMKSQPDKIQTINIGNRIIDKNIIISLRD
jgi:hypothetical protein